MSSLDTPPLYRRARPLMGTLVGVTVEAQTQTLAASATEAAFAEVRRLEAMFSPHLPESAVSQLNQSGGRAVELPREVAQVLALSLEVAHASGGAFDPTWAALAGVWRIGADDFTVPSRGALAAARRQVGFRRVRLEGCLAQVAPGTRLGLGGVAKGFIADRAATAALTHGATSVLVDAGGDLVARGPRSFHVGVQHPRQPALVESLALQDGALVTSADTERFSVHRGRRYHHLLDPRTGRPARACQSVSVLTCDAALADALATALFVLGPQGAAFLRLFTGVRALIIDSTGDVHRLEA